MVNKIKTRGIKRQRYSKRKKFSKYRKHHTRKFVKKFQRRVKRRRQTRNKRGGVFSIPPPNKVKDIIYQGYALVTKWGLLGPAIGAGKDRREQILIFISTNNSIYILRCVDNESDPVRCENPENVQIMGISLDSFSRGREIENEFFFKSLDTQEKYRIKLVNREETYKDFEQSVQNFILKVQAERKRVEELLSPSGSSKQAQDNSGEKVKIKQKSGFLVKDANASISITGKTTSDSDYPENIYTLFIDGEGKIKFLLRRNSGFSYDDKNDKKIDGKCYRLYKFTDMDDESNSIEIYVLVSRDEGSIFYTLQPSLASDLEIDIFDLCDEY
jgi:hypothetical protein